MPSSLNSSLGNWGYGERGMYLGMVIEPHYGLVAYLGGPRLCHRWHAKPIGPGSQDFGGGDRGDLVELAGIS